MLLKCVREYKLPSILCLLFIMGEVAIEVLIPFITADLINTVKAGAELQGIVYDGLKLILMFCTTEQKKEKGVRFCSVATLK